MNWIVGRGGLCAAGAALLAFTALLVGASTPSAASSYTLAYTGTVTLADGAFQALGAVAGDSVSGTMTIDPLNESPDTLDPAITIFNQSAIAFTFHLIHPGGLDLALGNSVSGFISNLDFPGTNELTFAASDPDYYLALSFQNNGAAAPLSSLSGLPNTPSALMAMLVGTSPLAIGSFVISSFGRVDFDIAYTATTPIPATLPLFVSALGGLGFIGWRRRKADSSTAALPA